MIFILKITKENLQIEKITDKIANFGHGGSP